MGMVLGIPVGLGLTRLSVYLAPEYIGTLAISKNGLVLALVGAWRYVRGFLLDPEVGIVEKVGLTGLILGLVVLLVSVYRQRRREARTDRYKEIIR